MIRLILLLALTFPLLAFAVGGDTVGNGGEVIACRDKSGKLISTELLDVFEARVIWGKSLKLGSPDLSVDQKLEIAFARIGKMKDHARVEKYKKWYKHFFEGVEWVTVTLPATPDVDPSLFPKGCAIEQIAIQRNTTNNLAWYEYGPAIKMSRPLWDSMNSDQRATLILHEIIFHDALYGRLTSAEPIRYFNALIFSGDLNQLNLIEYIEILDTIKAREIEINKINVELPPITNHNWKKNLFYPSGNPKEFKPLKDQKVVINEKTYQVKTDKEVIFHDSIEGTISFISFNDYIDFELPFGKVRMYGGYGIGLTPDQSIEYGAYVGNDRLITELGSSIRCVRDHLVYFQNGYLSRCYVNTDELIKGPDFEFRVTKAGEIFFDFGQIDWSNKNYNTLNLEGYVTLGERKVYLQAKQSALTWMQEINSLQIILRGSSVIIGGWMKLYTGDELAYFEPSSNFQYPSYNHNFPVAARCKTIFRQGKKLSVQLHPGGDLKRLVLSQDFTYEGNLYKNGTELVFDESGKILSTWDICGY